jgi:uncharacterized membrane protein YdbT with pleckstrin-like domain
MSNQEESIAYEAYIHWMIFWSTLQLFIIFTLIGGFLIFGGGLDWIEEKGFPTSYPLFALGGFFLMIFSDFIKQLTTLLTTRIYLTDTKLFLKTGLFNVQQMELPLRQIESVSVSQDFYGNLFNYGSLTFFGTGGRQPQAFWVADPRALSARFNSLQSAVQSRNS